LFTPKTGYRQKNHGVRASAVTSHKQTAASAKVPNDSRHISTTSEFDLHTNLNYASPIVCLTKRSR